MLDSLLSCPLAKVGKAAQTAPEPIDNDPLLLQFNSAVAPYSTNKLGVDWRLIERVGTELAGLRCELKVYGYLALAVFHNGLEGGSSFLQLGAVLISLGDILSGASSRCMPVSVSSRQKQLKWLSDELSLLIKVNPPKPAQYQDFAACVAAAEQTAEQAGTALGLSYPLLRELREALKEHQQAIPAPVPESAPVVTPAPTTAPVAALAQVTTPAAPPLVTATPVPAVTTASIVAPPTVSVAPPTVSVAPPPTDFNVADLSMAAVEDQLSLLVVRLTSHLRSESPESPSSYWLLRALRWAPHELLKPERIAEALANKGKSQIPPPQGHARLRKDFTQRLAEGQYQEVVMECEELFSLCPLWLDLQRFVIAGLAGMGAELARCAVQHQLSLLLELCPQLTELRFSDREGTPFADAETVRMLQSQGEPRSASGKATSTKESPQQPIPEELGAGVQFLQRLLGQANSGAERFLLRLRLGEFLLQNQRSDIAVPLVNLLLADIDSHRLMEWQPELVSKTLRLAVRAARAAELDADKRAILWNRICQVAPAEAVDLGPELLAPS